jgi:hypothetical protein
LASPQPRQLGAERLHAKEGPMLSFARRAAAMAVLLASAACADRPTPLEPASTASLPLAAGPGPAGSPSQLSRHDRLARQFALALHDAEFRTTVYRALQQSLEREGKVHFQRFLAEDHGRGRQRVAQLAGGSEADIASDLDQSLPIEIYLPVPEHRRRWRGGDNILVATATGDHDAPVAYDPSGHRLVLDPDRPPDMPVIALGQAETTFPDHGLLSTACLTCDEDPDGGVVSGGTGGDTVTGGGVVPSASLTGGLYMTYANLRGTFEGWLKGDPEIEVHILGQEGTSKIMTSYQCAGEKAGSPYGFDMNSTQWSGSVLLFSQAQLDAYSAEHPDQAIRVFMVEDDDGSCVIKTDSARVKKMFEQLLASYGTLTGGKDKQLLSVKTFNKAVTLFNLFKTGWSVITTQDDIIGNAVEDVVAGVFYPNANWIIKGENTITNGAIRLEMR